MNLKKLIAASLLGGAILYAVPVFAQAQGSVSVESLLAQIATLIENIRQQINVLRTQVNALPPTAPQYPVLSVATSTPPITGTSASSTVSDVKVIGGATLSVILDASSPAITLGSASTSGVTVSAYRFSATKEDIKLMQIGLMLAGTASNTPQDITKLSIWQGATKVSEAIFTSDTATTTLSTGTYPTVIIPKNSSVVLAFKVDTASIGVGKPARPGHLVRVEVDPNAGSYAGDATFGIGLTSGLNIYATGFPSPSYGIRLVKAVPVLASMALPSNTLVNGTIPLYRFSVNAPSTGGVGLYKFTFLVATSTVGNPKFAINNLQVRGYSDSAFSQPAYPNGGLLNSGLIGDSGGVTNDGPALYGIRFDPTAPTILEAIQVPAGSTRYFEFTGTVSNMSATSSSAVISLQGDASWLKGTNNHPDNADNFTGPLAGNYAFATTAINVDSGNEPHDDFIWSDNATTTSGVATYDWFNGFVLPGLPPTGMILVVLTP